MTYVAVERLRWGDDWILPGEVVPSGERERNYPSLLKRGVIREVEDLPPDPQLIIKDTVVIPPDWRDRSWNELRALALHFTNDTVRSKKHAIEVIEEEESGRSS